MPRPTQVLVSAAATLKQSLSLLITHGPAISVRRRESVRFFQMRASLSTQPFSSAERESKSPETAPPRSRPRRRPRNSAEIEDEDENDDEGDSHLPRHLPARDAELVE